jgi:hypothetical protein
MPLSRKRSLLADPDAVRPLLDKTVDLLRQALNSKLEAFSQDLHPTAKPTICRCRMEQADRCASVRI